MLHALLAYEEARLSQIESLRAGSSTSWSVGQSKPPALIADRKPPRRLFHPRDATGSTGTQRIADRKPPRRLFHPELVGADPRQVDIADRKPPRRLFHRSSRNPRHSAALGAALRAASSFASFSAFIRFAFAHLPSRT